MSLRERVNEDDARKKGPHTPMAAPVELGPQRLMEAHRGKLRPHTASVPTTHRYTAIGVCMYVRLCVCIEGVSGWWVRVHVCMVCTHLAGAIVDEAGDADQARGGRHRHNMALAPLQHPRQER
jgi:hypothetical protein